VPFSVITRKVLGSKTIGEAVNAVITPERGAGANYLIADENGECYDIETTARGFNHFYVDKYLGHANHYVAPSTSGKIMNSGTLIRGNRMGKLLKKHSGKINVETCFGFLKDHVSFPTSICTHPNEDLPAHLAMKTMDSIVISPAKREIHITRDNPCKTEFKKYSLQ